MYETLWEHLDRFSLNLMLGSWLHLLTHSSCCYEHCTWGASCVCVIKQKFYSKQIGTFYAQYTFATGLVVVDISKYKCCVYNSKLTYVTTYGSLLNTQKLQNKGHWCSEQVQRVMKSYHGEYLSMDVSMLLIIASAVAYWMCSAYWYSFVEHSFKLNSYEVYRAWYEDVQSMNILVVCTCCCFLLFSSFSASSLSLLLPFVVVGGSVGFVEIITCIYFPYRLFLLAHAHFS